MASIALIFPPYLSKYKVPPLGLAYIGSFLKKKGYSVSIIDMDPMNLNYYDIKYIIKDKIPDVVGISAMTPQIIGAFKVAEIVKEVNRAIPVVIGGYHASALPEDVLRNKSVDFVVIGEGELTFSELIESVSSNGSIPFEEVKGIGFRSNNKIKITPQRALIGDLDFLPFPLWEGLPIQKYSGAILGGSEKSKVYPILGTRGCPYHCTFCASNVVFRRVYRNRSARNIFDEISFLMKKYNANQFDFVDDTFTINKKVLHELCDLIIKNKLDIKWSLNARVNTVDEKMLRKIAEAGCLNVDFGVESGDPQILKSLKKGISLEQAKRAHYLAKKAGLRVTSFFMVGNLEEDWESVKKTVNFVKELDTDYPTCSIATPFPGTEMYEIANRNGWISVKDWDRYITLPHLMQDYKPVMVNGALSQEDILRAYYYVNAEFAKNKLESRYGKLFFFSYYFYRNEIIRRIKNIGLLGLFKLIWRLFRVKFTHMR